MTRILRVFALVSVLASASTCWLLVLYHAPALPVIGWRAADVLSDLLLAGIAMLIAAWIGDSPPQSRRIARAVASVQRRQHGGRLP